MIQKHLLSLSVLNLSLLLILSQISLVKLNQIYNRGNVQCRRVVNTKKSPLEIVFYVFTRRFTRIRLPDRGARQSTLVSTKQKSTQSPKIADGCQSKHPQLPAPVSRHSFFPWLLWAGGSSLVFLDKQIRFLLKQAAAVPSDNNVIIQNKWFSSLMRALLWVTKTRPHTDICLILSSWTLSSAGKFTGSDRSAVLKSD